MSVYIEDFEIHPENTQQDLKEVCAIQMPHSSMINIRFDSLCYSVPTNGTSNNWLATLDQFWIIVKGLNIFYLAKNKILLKSLNGQFRAGEFSAIMGPSGYI